MFGRLRGDSEIPQDPITSQDPVAPQDPITPVEHSTPKAPISSMRKNFEGATKNLEADDKVGNFEVRDLRPPPPPPPPQPTNFTIRDTDVPQDPIDPQDQLPNLLADADDGPAPDLAFGAGATVGSSLEPDVELRPSYLDVDPDTDGTSANEIGSIGHQFESTEVPILPEDTGPTEVPIGGVDDDFGAQYVLDD